VMLVPGAGDEVQALKAGIMEIADIFVVNKADRDGADALAQSIAGTLSLQIFAPGEWRPTIVKTQATSDAGTAELWAEIGRFRERAAATRATRQRDRQAHRLREVLSHKVLREIEGSLPPGEMESLMLANIPVTNDDLRQLAFARANAVKDYLIGSGKVEVARVFVLEPGRTPPERKEGGRGSRVDFSLR